jgi:two-component sensor histidine kinase
MNLQKHHVKDKEAADVLLESQNRVRSMAMIHEKLYKTQNFSQINFTDYIKNLIDDIFHSYNVDPTQIQREIILDEVMMGLETAIPCGLIISELATNTIKYAFPNHMKGKFRIKLYSVDDYIISLWLMMV